MTQQELINLIRANGQKYLACDEDWESEIIEWQTIMTIFEYGVSIGLEAPDFSLVSVLNAEDDESPGVPEIGCHDAIIDLMERIATPDCEQAIDAPEMRQMLELMEAEFGRGEV